MRFIPIVLVLACIVHAVELPRPLPDHPGNIFVAGEQVVVPVPAPDGPWKLADYERVANDFTSKDGKLDLGALPVGYYELQRDGAGDRITVAVIARLAAPTPATSPISIDVGMAWFDKTPTTQRAKANLCTLLGVNWVRDRLSWPDMEPTKGKFAEHNIYDDTADVQSQSGLHILQVNHISPQWANKEGKRFPHDLRDAYEFNKAMAARWKGKVLALEPWNEADIDMFGGHTGSEMATLQKAAYWGQKAGNPDIITCQNVFAIARQTTLDDFGANDASPYFDTYNLHHYVGFDKYPAYYADHRAVSGGKPMWVTECNVTVHWTGDPKKQEPNDNELRAGSRRIAKIFAMSIYEGSVNTFFFMLPHYVERDLQYGLIHEDMTPRPAFVAMAAVGRLMADAKPLGRLKSDDPKVHGYLFKAKPDGKEKFVFVGWCDNADEIAIKLDAPVEQVFDHLGREQKGSWIGEMKLHSGVQFAVMPIDPSSHLQLEPPPLPPARSTANASPLVLQADFPSDLIELNQSAYVLPPEREHALPIVLYNFGGKPLDGELLAGGPAGWTLELQPKVKIEPGERKELTVRLKPRQPAQGVQTVSFRFAADAIPAAKLSFRILDARPTTKP